MRTNIKTFTGKVALVTGGSRGVKVNPVQSGPMERERNPDYAQASDLDGG
jgi:hypothetical protein